MRKHGILLSLMLLVFQFVVFSVQAQPHQQMGIQFKGDFVQGALIRASVPSGTKVTLNGKPLKVSPEGKLAFGFDRDAPLQQTLVLDYPNHTSETKILNINKQDYRVQHVKGIAKQIMQPSDKDIARAIQDSAQVKQARNTNSELLAFSKAFIWPLNGPITGVYGSQRIYNGEPGRPHYGVDIAAPRGTKVMAPADGVVTLAVPDMFYSGGTMIIDHGYGVSSSFLHLSKLLLPVGTKVKQGEYVAEVGSTGRSTGAHLDWRINWYQMRLNPASVVPLKTNTAMHR